MSSNIDYGQTEDFRSKMAKFGAKLNNQRNNNYGNRPPPPKKTQNNFGGGGQYRPMQQQPQQGGMIKPSGGYGGSRQPRAPRKTLVKSKAARAMGRNEDAIKVNLDSVKSKVKFGRLVVYSVNCLGMLPHFMYIYIYIIWFNIHCLYSQNRNTTTYKPPVYHKQPI